MLGCPLPGEAPVAWAGGVKTHLRKSRNRISLLGCYFGDPSAVTLRVGYHVLSMWLAALPSVDLLIHLRGRGFLPSTTAREDCFIATHVVVVTEKS